MIETFILRQIFPIIAAACIVIAFGALYTLIHKKPKRKTSMSQKGHQYEIDVAKYLRRCGYWGVKVTGTSGRDYGVDIVARKGLFSKYAVQCKRYSNPVGVQAIQQVVAGKRVYNCNKAMVVTNNVFTKNARVLAEENGVYLIPNIG